MRRLIYLNPVFLVACLAESTLCTVAVDGIFDNDLDEFDAALWLGIFPSLDWILWWRGCDSTTKTSQCYWGCLDMWTERNSFSPVLELINTVMGVCSSRLRDGKDKYKDDPKKQTGRLISHESSSMPAEKPQKKISKAENKSQRSGGIEMRSEKTTQSTNTSNSYQRKQT